MAAVCKVIENSFLLEERGILVVYICDNYYIYNSSIFAGELVVHSAILYI